MPAIDEEVEAAEQEGVRFMFLASPHRIVGEHGAVKGIEVVRTRLGEFDPSGRRRPIAHRRSADDPLQQRHPGGRRRRGPRFLRAPRASVSRRAACSRSIATPGRPAARRSTPAATWSPAPPTSPTPWATARRRRATSTAASRGKSRFDDILPNFTYDQRPPQPRSLPPPSRRTTFRPPARAKTFDEAVPALLPEEAARRGRRCLRCDIRDNGGHAVIHH